MPEAKLTLAVRKAFVDTFKGVDGVWIKLVRDDGTEDPARALTSLVQAGPAKMKISGQPVFSHEQGNALGTGRYSRIRFYSLTGELLAEGPLTAPKAVQGTRYRKRPWWCFWEPRQEIIPGDVLILTAVSVEAD